jgi:hypothetical protein
MPATWIGGTIGNPNAYGVGTNWSGGVVPPNNDTITFSGSISCDLGGVNRTVAGVTFSGYTGTLALTGNLIVNGNVTLQATAINLSGTNALIVGGTSTFNPNGGNWSGNLQLGNATPIVVTLSSGFNVSGTLTFANTVSISGNVNLTALGSIVVTTSSIVSTPSASATTLVIAGATSSWSGEGRLGCNVNFLNASGAFSISGIVNFGSVVAASATPQMIFTSGSLTATGSTLGLVGNCSLSMQFATLNDVEFKTLNANSTYTITLLQDLNIGGSLLTGQDGNGSHTIARVGLQVINVSKNLTIGRLTPSAFLGSLNASTSSGAKIVMVGNASSTSTLSGTRTVFASSGSANWCNVDLEIAAGANTIALSSTNEFNFGNISTVSPITYRTLKYTSGTFTTTGSTINLGNSILDLGAQTLNNMRIYPNGSVNSFVVQLVSDLTITGSLITGTTGGNAGGAQLINGGSATNLNVQGGLSIGTNINNPIIGNINLRMKSSGTITGFAFCRNNIFFDSGTYAISDFLFGNNALGGAASEMTYVGGSVTMPSGTLTIANVLFDIASVQLNNLRVYVTTVSNVFYTLTIKSATQLRVNGEFSTGYYDPLPSAAYGGVTINNHASTPSTQMDVYGSLTIAKGGGARNYNGIAGNSKIYMKGTGNITSDNFSLFNNVAIDLFIQCVNVTLISVVMTASKKIEYVLGTFNTANSLTTIYGANLTTGATIKSNGQTWGDVGVRGGSLFTVDGNLTCRDLITYSADSFNTGIAGTGFTITIKRNLTLSQPTVVIAGNATGVNPIDKLIMDATDGGTGTWTSGGGNNKLAISLDLNAPTRTITIPSSIYFGNTQATRLRWFAGTTINATGSTLFLPSSATLDLGNQQWGALSLATNVAAFLESDAKFTNVTTAASGSGNYLNGITSPRTLTITDNLNVSTPVGTNATFQLVEISFDGSGTWIGVAGGSLNHNVNLVSGTRTLSGIINWGGGSSFGIGGAKTLQASGGSIAGGTSTFNIIGSNTISVDKTTQGSFNNVTTSANSTITLNAQMGILGTLTLNSLAANIVTFSSSSTFGWDAANFTHGGGNSTCILNAGSTYNVSGTFTMLGNNAGSRATLRSSKLSTFTNATANATTLTATALGGSPVEVGMVLSQASGVVPSGSGLAAIYPNRPIITSSGSSPFTLDPLYPVTPSTGPIAMEAGIKANFNLANGTGVALVLFATTKDINSIGGQTIYAFQSYLDAPSNPQADLFRTINWNTLAPPVSPIGIGFLSVT